MINTLITLLCVFLALSILQRLTLWTYDCTQWWKLYRLEKKVKERCGKLQIEHLFDKHKHGDN